MVFKWLGRLHSTSKTPQPVIKHAVLSEHEQKEAREDGKSNEPSTKIDESGAASSNSANNEYAGHTQQAKDDSALESDASSEGSEKATTHIASARSDETTKERQEDVQSLRSATNDSKSQSARNSSEPELSPNRLVPANSKRKAPQDQDEASSSGDEEIHSPQPRKKILVKGLSMSRFSKDKESDTYPLCSSLPTAVVEPETPKRYYASLRMKCKAEDDETRATSLDDKGCLDLPTRPRMTRSWSISSSVFSGAVFDRIDISSPSPPKVEIFRYLDLPQELQDIVLGFAFESDDVSRFPCYDYLIPDYGASESDPFVKGYRLWLTPHVKIQQSAVSRQFLRDTIRVLGRLAPIEVHTKRMAQKSRGGSVLNDKPLRRFDHPRQTYEDNIVQKLLTDLLAVVGRLQFKIWSPTVPQEILDQLAPLMPSLKHIEASMPHDLAWLNDRVRHQAPYGYLGWGGLRSIGLRLRNRVFKITVLSDEEFKMLLSNKSLPEALRDLFEHEPELAKYSTEIENYNVNSSDSKDTVAKSGEDTSGGGKYMKMSLSFNVEALVFRPRLDHDPYRNVTISVRFDGKQYYVTHVMVEENRKSTT